MEWTCWVNPFFLSAPILPDLRNSYVSQGHEDVFLLKKHVYFRARVRSWVACEVTGGLWRSGGIGSPAGVTVGCELSDVCAGNQTQVLRQSSNHSVSEPSLQPLLVFQIRALLF